VPFAEHGHGPYGKNQEGSKGLPCGGSTPKKIYEQWWVTQQGFSVGPTKLWASHKLWQEDPIMLAVPHRRGERPLLPAMPDRATRKAAEVISKYLISDMYAKAVQGMAPEEAVQIGAQRTGQDLRLSHGKAGLTSSPRQRRRGPAPRFADYERAAARSEVVLDTESCASRRGVAKAVLYRRYPRSPPTVLTSGASRRSPGRRRRPALGGADDWVPGRTGGSEIPRGRKRFETWTEFAADLYGGFSCQGALFPVAGQVDR